MSRYRIVADQNTGSSVFEPKEYDENQPNFEGSWNYGEIPEGTFSDWMNARTPTMLRILDGRLDIHVCGSELGVRQASLERGDVVLLLDLPVNNPPNRNGFRPGHWFITRSLVKYGKYSGGW